MGYYPSKICTLLQIVLMEGYGTLSCIIGGQVLSAVSGGGMSIVVGVVIVGTFSGFRLLYEPSRRHIIPFLNVFVV
jgi:purine-cytosine permease-like protein